MQAVRLALVSGLICVPIGAIGHGTRDEPQQADAGVPAKGFACRAIEISSDALPLDARDPQKWKWVGFSTMSSVDRRIAIDFREARLPSKAIGMFAVEVKAGEEDVWACGIRVAKPCSYTVLRKAKDKLTLVASGIIPEGSCPACFAPSEQTRFDPPFEELWSANMFRADDLRTDDPFPFAFLSWNGQASSSIARSKFRHPWETIPTGSSGGGTFDFFMKRLVDMPLAKWEYPVLVWTLMVMSPEGETQLDEQLGKVPPYPKPQENQTSFGRMRDGTAAIETEQEAIEMALWFLRGRGTFANSKSLETTAIETDTGWSVMVVDPDDRAIGSDIFVDISRDGWRVSGRAGH